MNEIKNKIDELKQIQKFPKYYLSQYFDELKTQVDTKYALKLDEKEKYLEIISIQYWDIWTRRGIQRVLNTYDNEINSIEEKLNNTGTSG